MNTTVIDKPSVVRNTSYIKNSIFKDGVLFYVAEGGKVFTLPKGKYESEKPLQIERELKRSFNPYRREWQREVAKPIKIHRVFNPHKASVFFDSGNIYLDTTLYDQPHDVVKKFVLYHELAHEHYKSEHKCDHFAKEMLLCEGYNPSQIDAAVKATGLNKKDRLKCISNDLKNEKRL